MKCDLSNSATCNDLEWAGTIISATTPLSSINISKKYSIYCLQN